jgi:hypothetical protein
VGQPKDSAIYFAVDFNCDDSDLARQIVPYFQSIRAVFVDRGSPYKIGVYGNGLACEKLLGTGLCAYTWLSNSTSFNGTKEFYVSKRWSLAQNFPDIMAALKQIRTNARPTSAPSGPVSAHSGNRPQSLLAQPQRLRPKGRLRGWLGCGRIAAKSSRPARSRPH